MSLVSLLAGMQWSLKAGVGAGTLPFAYAGHCLAGKSDEQEVNTRHRISVA
ncbi:MAG: hypothetical protein ABF752_00990 [Acetobacter fabarum]|uniref:hypothetical protein n=1 Tax=Acetobacter fabarum TaxID=483199 RepID=UPI0039EAC8B4